VLIQIEIGIAIEIEKRWPFPAESVALDVNTQCCKLFYMLMVVDNKHSVFDPDPDPDPDIDSDFDETIIKRFNRMNR